MVEIYRYADAHREMLILQQSISEKIQALKDKEVKLEKTIEKLSVEEDVDIDEAVITTTPLYKQLVTILHDCVFFKALWLTI